MPVLFYDLYWIGIAFVLVLVGSELIDFVTEREAWTQTELARGAGYVRTTKKGRENILVKKFLNELLAAQGLQINVGRTPGKLAQYETTVHKSGVILLGRTYSESFELEPGDKLTISIEEDCIKLVPKPIQPVISVKQTKA